MLRIFERFAGYGPLALGPHMSLLSLAPNADPWHVRRALRPAA